MSAVVQATCPGCKQVLRIPADWLDQPFRCKHCRTIIQARGSQPAPGRPAPSSQTPPPRPRMGKLVDSKPSARVTPIALPVASVLPPPAAIPVAAPAGGAAPAAVPVVTAPPSVPAAATIPVAAPAVLPGARPPRSNRSWLPMLVGLILLGGSAAATVVFWPQIAPLFENQEPEVASGDTKPPTDPPPD